MLGILERWLEHLVAADGVLRRLGKTALRWITGKCEIERILFALQGDRGIGSSERSAAMLEESLVKSRILGSFSTTTLFGDTRFDERAVAVRILEGKRLQTRSNILLQPLLECLILLNGNCIALETSMFLSSTKFDWSHELHRELLFGVWKNLVPGAPLQITPGKSVVSEEWKKVGFQGKDPATDFRGVGLLGLVQLHYFISTRPTLARRILKSSQKP